MLVVDSHYLEQSHIIHIVTAQVSYLHLGGIATCNPNSDGYSLNVSKGSDLQFSIFHLQLL